MKLTVKGLLFLIALASTLALAQTPPIQHVIVVIQENRSPDNLFGSDAFAGTHQLPNAHLSTYGLCEPIGYPGDTQITLTPFKLDACFDPDHSHQPAWNNTWDAGAMDGACTTNVAYNNGCTVTQCTDTQWSRYCPQYTYVTNAAITGNYHTGDPILGPYFNIATNYGFANYMFQTNQGPSFPAHQFLLSGTSAPDEKSDPQGFYQWFAAENPLLSNGDSTPTTGCAAAPIGEYVWEVSSSGGYSKGYDPPESSPAPGYPCYNHPTLVTLLDNAQLSWKYYNQGPAGDNNPGSSIWTAPNAISGICQASGGQCTGSDWANVIEPGNAGSNDASPILSDLGVNGTCNLPKVSWVIPDGYWSDHPGTGGANGGPGWVAAIVNAVGGVDNDNNPLPVTCKDTIGDQQYTYWQDTVILITWDDWGGFYDDVVPPDCASAPCSGYSNGEGGQYVYGFRVPLLVVSAYAKQGYVSGPKSGATCPGNYYCHDFGSILNFIEHTFSLGTINGATYDYADSLVMDTNQTYTYSLADFFDYTQQQRSFTYIGDANYPTGCYTDPTKSNQEGSNCFPNWPSDPDNDGTD